MASGAPRRDGADSLRLRPSQPSGRRCHAFHLQGSLTKFAPSSNIARMLFVTSAAPAPVEPRKLPTCLVASPLNSHFELSSHCPTPFCYRQGTQKILRK